MKSKWIIVRHPNMREERFLIGVKPISFDYNEELAQQFDIKQVLKISETLLEMGISHELRQIHDR